MQRGKCCAGRGAHWFATSLGSEACKQSALSAIVTCKSRCGSSFLAKAEKNSRSAASRRARMLRLSLPLCCSHLFLRLVCLLLHDVSLLNICNRVRIFNCSTDTKHFTRLFMIVMFNSSFRLPAHLLNPSRMFACALPSDIHGRCPNHSTTPVNGTHGIRCASVTVPALSPPWPSVPPSNSALLHLETSQLQHARFNFRMGCRAAVVPFRGYLKAGSALEQDLQAVLVTHSGGGSKLRGTKEGMHKQTRRRTPHSHGDTVPRPRHVVEHQNRHNLCECGVCNLPRKLRLHAEIERADHDSCWLYPFLLAIELALHNNAVLTRKVAAAAHKQAPTDEPRKVADWQLQCLRPICNISRVH